MIVLQKKKPPTAEMVLRSYKIIEQKINVFIFFILFCFNYFFIFLKFTLFIFYFNLFIFFAI